MSRQEDFDYMQRALQEARRGLGRTAPNPAVGAVVVRDGQIVGLGYHHQAGTPHAEVHALAAAGKKATGATVYVTLEPCSHTGKTPPCCVALVKAGVARVVVGMLDPNPLVNGKGVAYLRNHGVEVTENIAMEQCQELVRPFVKRITTGMPWLICKAGITLDGRLSYQKGKSAWITGPESGRYVHQLRNQVDAIMVGSATVKIDNPALTTRLDHGEVRHPIAVVVDRMLTTDPEAQLYQSSNLRRVFLFCSEKSDGKRRTLYQEKGVELFIVPEGGKGLDLKEVVRIVAAEGVCSLLVEGGAHIHGEFLAKKLYDYVYLFQAPLIAGDGGQPLFADLLFADRVDAVRLRDVVREDLGEDQLIRGRLSYTNKE